MKLNLGCGANKIDGCVNVDKSGEPDVWHDLEVFPWPFEDNSAELVVLHHVLEHLGATADVFIGVVKELYRVCANGAEVVVNVPHYRHENFYGDPTHVRVVTPQMLDLFNRAKCEKWIANRMANSPLALYHGVNFERVSTKIVLEEPWATQLTRGDIDQKRVDRDERIYNNVAREYQMVLRAVK